MDEQARHPAPNLRQDTLREPVVEILYFDGCPNYEQTHALVGALVAELGLKPKIELVGVPDAEAAARLRFLGSPTVRVDGGRRTGRRRSQRVRTVLPRLSHTAWPPRPARSRLDSWRTRTEPRQHNLTQLGYVKLR